MSHLSRLPRTLTILTLLALATLTTHAGGDGIQLTVDRTGLVSELSWTGGQPAFLIHRSLDAETAAAPASVRDATNAFQWDDQPARPPRGEAFYYLVGETEIQPGDYPAMWINGETCASEPLIQVHQYNADTFILRQSLCTSFEGPFMFLLFGENEVLMQDTGDGGIPIADTVYAIIDQWLFDHDKTSIQLTVSHSHSHGDHVQGDSQFQGQPNTTVVGLSQAAVAGFFGITSWPTEIVTRDLGGGRILDVIPIPGHQSASIALYDRRTGLLFTGDTLYPGRLYISSFSQYVDSIQRMVDFVADKPVVRVLGTHIEMTTIPFEDYPFGATVHIDEHELPLRRDHLLELLQGVLDMVGNPVIEAHRDFIIFPL